MPRRSDGQPSIGPAKRRSRKKSPREIQLAATRAQQDSLLYNLTLDINDLRQELQDLALRRAVISTRSFFSRPDSPSSILHTVGRYFDGFERGYRGNAQHPEHSAFVRSIADEELSLGVTGLGVDMLLEQWQRYSDVFHVRENALRSAEVITNSDASPFSGTVVKCGMEVRGVLTRHAVDTIFPNAHREPFLMLRALGRKVKIPLLFHLYFNSAGRLVRHDVEADFFAAVRGVLDGDSSGAARFVEDARLGQESMLGPLTEQDDVPVDVEMPAAIRSPETVCSSWTSPAATGDCDESECWGFEDPDGADYVEMIDDDERHTTMSRPSATVDRVAIGLVDHAEADDEGSAFGEDAASDDPTRPNAARRSHSLAFLLSPR